MKRLLAVVCAALSLVGATTASAQMFTPDNPGYTVEADTSGKPIPPGQNGVNWDAPFQGAIAFVPDTPQAVQRSIGVNCTVAGNISVTLADTSTIVLPVQVGWQTFPFAVTTVNSSGTTATCAYSNLK